jgi:hypothetical protein
MAHACDYDQWLPMSPSLCGFAFDDSYSSEEGSVILTTNPHKRCARPGLTHVQAAYMGSVARAHAQPTHAPPPRPVPPSARRQERMREPAHDEQRAVHNCLPQGMMNPRDLLAHAKPSTMAGVEE